MATAQDLIKDALRLIGVIASGETPTADESNDGLNTLNRMLGSWSTRRTAIYAETRESVTAVANTASYTIGSSGTWNTTRPIKINAAFIRDGSDDYPVAVIHDRHEYERITDKASSTGMPTHLYYDPAYALGTVFLYPIPDEGYTLHLISHKPLTSLSALTTTVTLPPGYEEAVIYNLGVRMGPEYGRPIPPEIAAVAGESLKSIMSNNAPRPVATFDAAILPRKIGINVYTGE